MSAEQEREDLDRFAAQLSDCFHAKDFHTVEEFMEALTKLGYVSGVWTKVPIRAFFFITLRTFHLRTAKSDLEYAEGYTETSSRIAHHFHGPR